MFSLKEFNETHRWNFPLVRTPPKIVDDEVLKEAMGMTRGKPAWNTPKYFAVIDIKERPRIIIQLLSAKKLHSCRCFVQLREYLKTLPDPFDGADYSIQLLQVKQGKVSIPDPDQTIEQRQGEDEVWERHRQDIARRKLAAQRS